MAIGSPFRKQTSWRTRLSTATSKMASEFLENSRVAIAALTPAQTVEAHVTGEAAGEFYLVQRLTSASLLTGC